MAGLSRALKVFEDKNMNLVHIESRLMKGTQDQYEIYLEIDSETSRDWNEIQQLIDTLRSVYRCTGMRSSSSLTPSGGLTWVLETLSRC